MPTLTEAEKLDIAMILGVTYIDVNDKVTNLGDNYITAAVETKIRTELTRWTTAGVDFVKVHPREKNFGAEIDPEREKLDIKKRLAALLYFTNLQFGGQAWGYSPRA